jgi:tellurite methyltransferase
MTTHRITLTPESVENWKNYYKNTKDSGKCPILTTALGHIAINSSPHVSSLPLAIDIGCGAGKEMAVLLDNGFRVLGIDICEEAEEWINTSLAKYEKDTWSFSCQAMEQAEFPKCDLINASKSLYFCQPRHFSSVWESIYNSLNHKGYFVGEVLGNQDGWVTNGDLTGFTLDEVTALLSNYNVLFINEVSPSEQLCADNTTSKVWHVVNFVAQKV